ncbi:MAG: hypothetical protein LBR17_01330 [Bacteroidales bacterium]|jgi:hypothetical protein|nr:hypothetical protein [Bacteroidales bacterium]
MKKIFLTVVVALCSLIAKGQFETYNYSNYFLLPPCMTSGNLPLIQPLSYDSACNNNITFQLTPLSPLFYNGIVSQVAQPYYTDTYVSIKGLAASIILFYNPNPCQLSMYLQKPIGNILYL